MPARMADRAPNEFPFSREFIIEATGGSVVWRPEREQRITHLAFLSEEPDVPLELVPSYPLVEQRLPPPEDAAARGRVWFPPMPTFHNVGLQRVVTSFSSKHLGVLWPHPMQLPVPLSLPRQQEFIVRGPRGIAVLYGTTWPDWSQGIEES